MAMYRILYKDKVYTLDATLQGSLSLSGEVTEKPLQDGVKVADHYVNNPNTASLSGIVSDVKLLSGSTDSDNKAVLDWITELRTLKESGDTFIFEQAPSSGTVLSECVFTSLEISNDQKYGEFWGEYYAFRISASIKQIKKASRGQLVAQPDSAVIGESTTTKKTGSGTTAAPSDTDTSEDLFNKAKELSDKGFTVLSNAVGG